MEEINSTIRNAFKLEGKVHQIKRLISGVNHSTGKEWLKLDIVLSMESKKHNSVYYYPIVLWNARAKSAAETIGCNDYIRIK